MYLLKIHKTYTTKCIHACSVAKLCLTLFNSVNCSSLGSFVHGILQARILSGLPGPPPGDLPDPGIKYSPLVAPALASGVLPLVLPLSQQNKFSVCPSSELRAALTPSVQSLGPVQPATVPSTGEHVPLILIAVTQLVRKSVWFCHCFYVFSCFLSVQWITCCPSCIHFVWIHHIDLMSD